MKHTIIDMSQRTACCSCGHESQVSAIEFAERGEDRAQDLLLDRHNAHVALAKELGR